MSVSNDVSMAKECRSMLYMPASNQRALEKGPTLLADAIILDLEDSVGPAEKVVAREQAIHALVEFDYGYRVKALRINTAESAYYQDDVAAIAQALPDAIVLPKVESELDVLALSNDLDKIPGADAIDIWAMIESPRAILNAERIAANGGKRLKAFLIGNNDLAKAANMPVASDRTYLIPWLMSLVAVAHTYSLALIDSVFNDFADPDGFLAECQQGVAMGMHGKTLIHPSQISAANAVYSPAEQAVADAKDCVKAFAVPENKDAGVIQLNGRMVERLHLTMAEELLKKVARLEQRK